MYKDFLPFTVKWKDILDDNFWIKSHGMGNHDVHNLIRNYLPASNRKMIKSNLKQLRICFCALSIFAQIIALSLT